MYSIDASLLLRAQNDYLCACAYLAISRRLLYCVKQDKFTAEGCMGFTKQRQTGFDIYDI